jgi:hypothetical protein
LKTATTARTVVDALEEKHQADVFIAECNLGSAAAACRRMDAWVLRKSWSPWTTIGYEVKVNRQDFLNDRKWIDYLPACHELWFACPARLIDPAELPPDVGLLWLASTGRRFVTKRKAVRREPDPKRLAYLMSYALMSRARIVRDMWQANGEQETVVDKWRKFLQARDGRALVGRLASRKISQIIERERDRRHQAEHALANVQAVEQRLADLGLGHARTRSDIERALGLFDGAALNRIEHLADEIKRMVVASRPAPRPAVEA